MKQREASFMLLRSVVLSAGCNIVWGPIQTGVALTLHTSSREMLTSNFGRDTGNLD
jgi:hypothetical protein